jgi:Type II secretion system (T2SS), protein G
MPSAAPAESTPPPPVDPEVAAKAVIDLDKVGLMLRDYRSRMGENPFGTNAEIMKAVMGGNPKQARLGPPEGQTLNAEGELVDRWGTPYFFHQMSKSDMEIRSAGPDRKMWTEDDVIGR